MIATYQELRRWLTEYFLSDARISSQGIIWGESIRQMDAQNSGDAYPCVWIADTRYVREERDSGSQLYGGWEVGIEITDSSLRGDVVAEDSAMNLTFHIMQDFLAWLEGHRAEGLKYNYRTFSVLPAIVGDENNAWGWNVRFRVLEFIGNRCAGVAYTPTCVLEPVWVNGGATLALTISGDEFFVPWISIEGKATAIEQLAATLRDAGIEALADFSSLYVATEATIVSTGSHTLLKTNAAE